MTTPTGSKEEMEGRSQSQPSAEAGAHFPPSPEPLRFDGKWRPIETAPRDGKTILLWSAAWEMTWGVQVGFYNGGDEWVTGEGSVSPDDDEPCEGDEEDDGSDGEPLSLLPTHWMPLPLPPRDEPAACESSREAPTLPSREELERALRRIAEANPQNTNSATADRMASWTRAVAQTALTSKEQNNG